MSIESKLQFRTHSVDDLLIMNPENDRKPTVNPSPKYGLCICIRFMPNLRAKGYQQRKGVFLVQFKVNVYSYRLSTTGSTSG